MKRLQIMIEEELDETLALEARKHGTSQAALIRRFVRVVTVADNRIDVLALDEVERLVAAQEVPGSEDRVFDHLCRQIVLAHIDAAHGPVH